MYPSLIMMEEFLKTITNHPAGESARGVISKILPYARSSRQHPALLAAGIALSYVLLCRALRYRRVNAQRKRLGYTTRKAMANMTNVDAQLIIKNMAELEFPLLFKQSLNFALFKVRRTPPTYYCLPLGTSD
jgi:hypothetical protein